MSEQYSYAMVLNRHATILEIDSDEILTLSQALDKAISRSAHLMDGMLTFFLNNREVGTVPVELPLPLGTVYSYWIRIDGQEFKTNWCTYQQLTLDEIEHRLSQYWIDADSIEILEEMDDDGMLDLRIQLNGSVDEYNFMRHLLLNSDTVTEIFSN